MAMKRKAQSSAQSSGVGARGSLLVQSVVGMALFCMLVIVVRDMFEIGKLASQMKQQHATANEVPYEESEKLYAENLRLTREIHAKMNPLLKGTSGKTSRRLLAQVLLPRAGASASATVAASEATRGSGAPEHSVTSRAAAVAVVHSGITKVADRFGVPASNSSNQHGCHHNKTSCNPTHYGSPLKNGQPLFCQADEDGLILDSFVYNPVTGKTMQVAFMWCSPNLTRIGSSVCPNDMPAGAKTTGAKAMPAGPGMSKNCFMSCTRDSDCGGGAVCADETNRTINGTHIPGALPANMCSWSA